MIEEPEIGVSLVGLEVIGIELDWNFLHVGQKLGFGWGFAGIWGCGEEEEDARIFWGGVIDAGKE